MARPGRFAGVAVLTIALAACGTLPARGNLAGGNSLEEPVPLVADADEDPGERLVTDRPDFDGSKILGADRDVPPGSAAEGDWARDIGKCAALPVRYRASPFELLSCLCDAEIEAAGPIWGTGLYSGDSPICTAALHAGIIDRSGGRVAIQTLVDQPGYKGSLRNGVESSSRGETSGVGAYRFVE